jgi:hypothetical protein
MKCEDLNPKPEERARTGGRNEPKRAVLRLGHGSTNRRLESPSTSFFQA